jgi:hypothetical protein
MKTLSIILLSLFLISFVFGDNKKGDKHENEVCTACVYSNLSEKENAEATVIICTGKYSKRYHNSMCKGMKACKGERKKVSLEEAKRMGLTPCRYCYK